MEPHKLHAFCSDFATRNKETWPPDEELLAKQFLSHFQLPPFLHGANLGEICEKLDIQFVKEKLPNDLLGSNFRFAGKRRIAINDRPERVGMKEHTFFHEMRELLEYDFREIGFPTTEKNGEELESRADEFALCLMCGQEETWEKLTKSTFQMRSTWSMIGTIVLIFVARIAYLLNAQSCAQYMDRGDL
jgi:hypothetical protein